MTTGTVALKENQIQLVTDLDGNIRAGNRDGHGLYMFDTRYLSAFELSVNGESPIYLSHSAERNYIATFQFVNPVSTLRDGRLVPRQTISIRRSRFVNGQAFYERIGFYNCNHFPVELELGLNFDADFQDVFAIRGFSPQRRGGSSSIHLGSDRLDFSHIGRDKVKRLTKIRFDRRARACNHQPCRLPTEP